MPSAPHRLAHSDMPGRKSRKGGLAEVGGRPGPKGRAVDAEALARVRALIGDAPRSQDMLIEHLHRIQDACGHLSAAHLNALAFEMHLTQAEVYEVASFYHHFDIVKEGDAAPPPLTVRVCESISCNLAGSRQLLADVQSRLGAEVRVIAAPCIGRCDGAPAAVVGRRVVENADAKRVEQTVDAGEYDAELPSFIDYARYRAADGYRTLASCVAGEYPVEQIIDTLAASGLRGLGGAGFPSGRKWQFVRAEAAPRLVVLNADEGEPGTFKDRYCLEIDPHRVLEGLLIAAWAVEAAEVYIYLRDEYAAARRLLTDEIAALQLDPPCSIPRIHMRRGAGAYICGEETALIESLEGKRGEPRLRPPFPAQVGLFGRPTLVHNVETVYWIRQIIENGPAPFAAKGVRARKGIRLFSVSGRVKKPGVYPAPAGVTVRELIEDYAGGMARGHEFYAYMPGGASGGILPASLGDVALDFDVLAEYGSFIGSAAIIVLSDQDRATDAALNLMQFFAHESCGKCTPCRSGTAKAVTLMQEPHWDTHLLAELGESMSDASICGLGQAAPNPVRCVTQFFPHELAR
jgi:NADH:ubiquinone oxidoreductase subunit F (NADH-binding)/NADH:ubiquinone oxidoreductase subunit E